MNEIQLDKEQIEAVERCIDLSNSNRMVGISGPPGSGKTTILTDVHAALVKAGYKVILVAPTGKAARRITEVTNIEAFTIHRALEYTKPGDIDERTGKPVGYSYPRRTRFAPLEHDVILIDEASMPTHELYRAVVDACKPGAAVRMFGDVNQLPPIEKSDKLRKEPTPFENVLERFKGVKLKNNYRQKQGSAIAENAMRLLNGQTPIRGHDFGITLTQNHVGEVLKLIEKTHQEIGEEVYYTNEGQIISPGHRANMGTRALNATIQTRRFGQSDGFLQLPRLTKELEKNQPVRVHVGDKIRWTQNDMNLNLNNGDTGIIQEITPYEEIIIDFGYKVETIPPDITFELPDGTSNFYDPRKYIELGYVITTHAAQGTEIPYVIYIASMSHGMLLTRPNIYTAITRARKYCHLIAEQRALVRCVRNVEKK